MTWLVLRSLSGNREGNSRCQGERGDWNHEARGSHARPGTAVALSAVWPVPHAAAPPLPPPTQQPRFTHDDDAQPPHWFPPRPDAPAAPRHPSSAPLKMAYLPSTPSLTSHECNPLPSAHLPPSPLPRSPPFHLPLHCPSPPDYLWLCTKARIGGCNFLQCDCFLTELIQS